ncbi:MAG: hypothetical protein ACRDJP_01770 [Actinomycetota bacterium]
MSVESTAFAVRSRPALLSGAAAGIFGAVVMAMFAMVAGATYHGVGFFTPMYHIASSLLGPETMMESAARGQAGDLFYLAPGPAALGMMLHLAVGAVFGAILPMVGSLLRARGAGWVPLGILYGAAVLALMSFVGLPITASLFGGGDPIRDMPQIAGWWTFGLEHLLYGAVLGLWFWRRGTAEA